FPSSVLRVSGEVAAHGAEEIGGGVFDAVVGAQPLDRQAGVASVPCVRSGDDDHTVAFPDEDTTRGTAVRAFGHERLGDPDALAAVVGEGVRVGVRLCPDQSFDVLGRPGPVDAAVLDGA